MGEQPVRALWAHVLEWRSSSSATSDQSSQIIADHFSGEPTGPRAKCVGDVMKIARLGGWRRALNVGWIPLVFTLVCNAAATEYKLAPGDVVEITIAGLPEWHHRVAIQFDGTISLPTLGIIEIAGLTAAEMRNEIAAVLRHDSSGRGRPRGANIRFWFSRPISPQPLSNTDLSTSMATS